jgi:hypothetical protein
MTVDARHEYDHEWQHVPGSTDQDRCARCVVMRHRDYPPPDAYRYSLNGATYLDIAHGIRDEPPCVPATDLVRWIEARSARLA